VKEIIKFRAKKLDNGEWVHGYYVKVHNSEFDIRHFIFPDIHDIFNNLGCYEVNLVTVGQFIGLTDKNETEIYKGDVFMIAGIAAFIQYGRIDAGKKEYIGYYLQEIDGDRHFTLNGIESKEIVGNIYESVIALEMIDL